MIIGIDPGLEKSAIVELSGTTVGNVFWKDNSDVLHYLGCRHSDDTTLAIEMIQSYGMPVGSDIFHTCVWIGRFQQRWEDTQDRKVYKLCRKSSHEIFPGIGKHLCHSNNANDSTIRQALIDRFPRDGNGSVPQIGTASEPGPLYSIQRAVKGASKHTWQALAVAVVAQDVLDDIANLGKEKKVGPKRLRSRSS